MYVMHGYSKFSIGQSQKWLNMAIKYSLSLARIEFLKVSDAADLRGLAHVPIDNYIIAMFSQVDVTPPWLGLKVAWSRIDNNHAYFELQAWVRELFLESAPLDVEFKLWNDMSDAISDKAHSKWSNVGGN